MENTDKKYYSLLQITRSLESVIQKTYTKSYWVKAEIAKLNYYSHSGHCYPELVEKEGNKVLAQIRSTIWAGNFDRINKKFREITRENLADGMRILFLARVGFHPVYGISLNISDIEPAFTLGEMARERNASIQRLQKEGIFEQNKRLPLPLLPQRIAVISVETSKGYHDFTQIIENNNWAYSFFHLLFPALLQGEGAVKSIKAQLARIKKAIRHFDVVVIIRGGGGDIGLSSFDSYSLAKAVATFPVPVLSGIGHATNETVVEMVAHANKITPTDLAYFLIQQFHNFSVRLQESQKRMVSEAQRRLQTENRRVNETVRQLNFATQDLVNRHQSVIRVLAQQMGGNTQAILNTEKDKLTKTISLLQFKPTQLILSRKASLSNTEKNLGVFSRQNINAGQNRLVLLNEKVNLLKPENILKRGYSITTFNGKPIRDARQLSKNEVVETTVFKGKFKSRIETIDDEK
ncbi:MAG: exodeoxyribonuclease VII large subunit [Bacteroidales bacterium]|nr:exodeoxyribonuclease VII large subunit [Bacteroidales bacterium]